MAGLLTENEEYKPPSVDDYKPSESYDATKVETDAKEYAPVTSVSERMTSLLSSDNPYIKQARQSAKEQANSRGLLNSSIAAGSGERAAIQSALPIAQQDAETANKYGAQEQAFNYNAAMQDAEAANAMTQTQLQGDYGLAETGYSGEIRGSLMDQEARYNQEIQELKGEIDKELYQIQADSKTRSMVMEATGKIHQQYLTDKQELLTDPDLSAGAKKAYLQALTDNYKDSINNELVLSGFDFEVFDAGGSAEGGSADGGSVDGGWADSEAERNAAAAAAAPAATGFGADGIASWRASRSPAEAGFGGFTGAGVGGGGAGVGTGSEGMGLGGEGIGGDTGAEGPGLGGW